MKAKYYFMVAAAGLLAACSSNDDFSDGPNPEIEDNAKVPITLGVTAQVQTRGTGTVGGTTQETNFWSSQLFNVLMLNKDQMSLALFDYSTKLDDPRDWKPIYEGEEFKAPAQGTGKDGANVTTGVATATDNSIEYYPASGNFDFWGYRIDDAGIKDTSLIYVKAKTVENAEPTKELTADIETAGAGAADDNDKVLKENEVRATANQILLPFHIDGSQDIMSGKAKYNGTLPDGFTADRIYSASAARKNIQPEITFNHHLARLVFRVVAGNKSAAGKSFTYTTTPNADNPSKMDTTYTFEDDAAVKAVNVTAISVVSRSKGRLAVAYTEAAKPDTICKFWPGTEELSLKERQDPKKPEDTLATLKPVALAWDLQYNDKATPQIKVDSAVVKNVGEALLIAPGQTAYPLKITMTQQVSTKTDGTTQPTDRQSYFDAVLKLDGTKKFEANKSYIVTVKVYGLEKIVVSATLAPWEEGGNIDIDTDKEEGGATFTPASVTSPAKLNNGGRW